MQDTGSNSKCVMNLAILELKINVIQLVNAKFMYSLNLPMVFH